MIRVRTKLISLGIMVFVLVSSIVISSNLPQTVPVPIDGRLVYFQVTSATDSNYATIKGTNKHIFDLLSGGCTLISPDGRYAIESTLEPTSLKVWRLADNTLILETSWSSEWQPCYFPWLTEHAITLRNKDTGEVSHYIVTNGQLEPTTWPPPPPFPNLPDGYPELFHYGDPTGRYFLYERCTGDIVEGSRGYPICSVESDLVIYDLSTQQVLHNVTETDVLELQLNRSYSWSPDGRYLTFELSYLPPGITVQHPNLVGFTLRIFDTSTSTIFETGYPATQVDGQLGYVWSPDSAKVAFWAIGEQLTETPDENIRQLMMVDMVSGQTMVTNIKQPYETGLRPEIVWSPDSSALAFVAADESLFFVNADDGQSIVLDTNVHRIVTWQPNMLPIAEAYVDSNIAFSGASEAENEPPPDSPEAFPTFDTLPGITLNVVLHGENSVDPDGTIVNYEWKRGQTVIYSGPQNYADAQQNSCSSVTYTLTVTDDYGATDSDTTTFNPGGPC